MKIELDRQTEGQTDRQTETHVKGQTGRMQTRWAELQTDLQIILIFPLARQKIFFKSEPSVAN